MINDSSSSVPVKTLSDGFLFNIKGTANGKYLKVHLLKIINFQKLEILIVTSGNAKIFPRDILVAKVIDVKEDYYIAITIC